MDNADAHFLGIRRVHRSIEKHCRFARLHIEINHVELTSK